jgi:uncharacterized membrane protein
MQPSITLRPIRAPLDRRLVAVTVGSLLLSMPILPFGWHLALHIAGAAMLIGNALVMAVWLTVAAVSRRESWQRRAARAVIMGDVFFTVPGVVLILANGLAMVGERYGGLSALTSTPFIAIGLVLLTGTGLVWATQLVPVQREMVRLTEGVGRVDQAAFASRFRRWTVWGIVATVLPVAAVVVMTTKPTF